MTTITIKNKKHDISDIISIKPNYKLKFLGIKRIEREITYWFDNLDDEEFKKRVYDMKKKTSPLGVNWID